jgi:hypothetical protein
MVDCHCVRVEVKKHSDAVSLDGDWIWFCGATRGTDNTSEIIGIGQALMWLRDVDEAIERSAP